MADHVLESRVTIARPRPEVFAFFADPRNLSALTPPALHLTLLSPVTALSAGAVLDYALRWWGIPLRWRAFVREYDPPFRFLDVQVRGPCARWEHRHRFLREAGGEATTIEDRIVYRLPAGPLGRLGHALAARRAIAELWRYRTRAVRERLGPFVGEPRVQLP
jgi:ligand-binding SRPBCC domain-containing protein